MRRRGLAVGTALLLFVALSRPAGATGSAVIEVYPGPDAIARAIQHAQPGDILNIHTGRYPEGLIVPKRLTLRAAGDGPVTVDAGCQGSTFEVQANGVALIGLRMIGGDFFDVDFEFVSGGQVSDSEVMSTCPDAEYGINLYATGPMLIEGNTATGFTDAGIYIGGIVDTGGGAVIARHNEVFGNNNGVIVQDSAGVALAVQGNRAHDNVEDGIFLQRSDGIEVRGNSAWDNGYAGIELDPESDGNLVSFNRARGQTYDLANDGGVGNCFKNNRYSTSYGTIAC
jgi:parallel beta-helix repeat protein